MFHTNAGYPFYAWIIENQFDARYRINNTGLIKTASIRPFVLLNSYSNSIVPPPTSVHREFRSHASDSTGEATISREEGGIDRSRNSRNPTTLDSRRNFPARNNPLPSSPSKTRALFLPPGWPLAYSLFTGQHRPPLIKPRDGWAVKLYKLLISRETYTSRKETWRGTAGK